MTSGLERRRGRRPAGRITEKHFVEVNGSRQGMFIEGPAEDAPVLLYLHGGIPDAFLARRHPTGLPTEFIVVSWERRGSGMSFTGRELPSEMTLDQFVADTISVTDHLRERFARDRILLMAHSGGTFIGIQAVAAAPDRFAGYVGVAQMASQLDSEVLAYQWMVDRFRIMGDTRMVRRLEAAPVTREGGVPGAYLGVRDVAMHRLGVGTMHDMHSIVSGLILPSLAFGGYSIRERANLWRAKRRQGVTALWSEMLATDLADAVPELAVPAYFLHGIHDYTCAYSVAKEYVQALRAPVKGFYTFERSAHSPMFEEPERTLRILREDVLSGATHLADPMPGTGGAR